MTITQKIELAARRAEHFAAGKDATMAMKEIAVMMRNVETDMTAVAEWCDLLEQRAEREDHAAQYRVIAKRLRSA